MPTPLCSVWDTREMGRQEKESLEVDREGSGERIVPGACKAFISVVRKGQRRGGGLETLPGVSRYWAQPGRPSWCSKHMAFTKKSWWPTVQGVSWLRVTKRQQWLFNCAQKWRNPGIHSLMKRLVAREGLASETCGSR